MFKLNIECSKDFEELNIKFKDGTSISTEKMPDKGAPEYLDTNAEFGGISGEVVKPPDIEDHDRSPNVAEELQNLDL